MANMSEITGLSEIFGSDSENGENEDSKEEIAPVGSADQSADSNEEEGTSENVKSDDEERPEEEASDAENSESDNNQETAKKSDNEEEDSDEEVISRKREKKNDVDVFGEELSDLSDDSDENKEAASAKENDDEEEEPNQVQAEQEEEEVEPEQIINIEIPRVKTDLGRDVHFVKLPNFLSVEPRPFDPDMYDDDLLEKTETVDEEGQARVRLKVENTIRWRYDKESEGNLVKQSNAKIVKWSDGSLSLYIGNEIFDVYKTFMQGDHNHLFVRQGNVLHGQTIFKTKLAFRPHSTDSMTHRKMTMSLIDRTSKLKKVKILAEIKKNPENMRNELMKKEEEKLKAASRRQNQQRRIREKSHSKGLSANYLEDRYNTDDDDNGAVSLSAIKNKFKSRKEVYSSSSDESENERRLNKVKQAEDNSGTDSDEDGGIYSKKSSLTKKKKVKHVVSDDDEN